eukprot:SAG31_NODE_12442_length_942_cov_0.979834_3_plen_58_part_01
MVVLITGTVCTKFKFSTNRHAAGDVRYYIYSIPEGKKGTVTYYYYFLVCSLRSQSLSH